MSERVSQSIARAMLVHSCSSLSHSTNTPFLPFLLHRSRSTIFTNCKPRCSRRARPCMTARSVKRSRPPCSKSSVHPTSRRRHRDATAAAAPAKIPSMTNRAAAAPPPPSIHSVTAPQPHARSRCACTSASLPRGEPSDYEAERCSGSPLSRGEVRTLPQ